MKQILLALAMIVFSLAVNANELKPVVVALAGSSSCQAFKQTDPELICGWGEVIDQFFTAKVEVKNFAVSGRSTKSFRARGDWDKLLASKPDYVLMTIGANDTVGKRDSTDVETEFRENLRRFASEAEAIGAKMVFVTINQSMMLRKGKVSFDGKGRAVRSDRIPYSQAIREVAAELHRPCLELALRHQEELEAYGERIAVKLFRYDPKRKGIDPSHSNRKGAILMARIIAEELGKSDSPLKNYLDGEKLAGAVDLGLPKYVAGKYLVVDQGHPQASDDNPGTPDEPFLTINAAAQKAKAGSTVLVYGGVYRERISPVNGGGKDEPVVFWGVDKEKVVVKGSEVWKPEWKAAEKNDGIFMAKIDSALFRDGVNPYLIGISVASRDKNPVARPSTETEKLPFTLGQIFANGVPLIQVRSRTELKTTLGSWLVEPSGEAISLKLPEGVAEPADCLLEISVRNRIFCPRKRGLKNIHVRGFTFMHCANQGPFPQGGAVSVRSGRNWIVEDNVIRYAKMVGLDCGSETWATKELKDTDAGDRRLIIGGGHLIRGNVISDNGLCGIAGWNHKGTKILGNILERNNRLNIAKPLASWEEWAAIKLHGSDALIEGNLIRDNNAFGIWIDNGYKNARILGNLLHNNQKSGIFLELGAGRCLVANNIVSATRPQGTFYKGFGVYAHDASGITVANNLFVGNSGAAVLMRTVSNRKFGRKPTETSGEEIFNNLMVNNGGGVFLPLEYVRGKENASDYNYFSHGTDGVAFGWPWSCGGPDGKRKIQTIRERAEKSGNPRLLEEFKDWEESKSATVSLWREVSGWDRNSMLRQDGVKVKLEPKTFTVSIEAGKAFLEMKCPPVDKVERDILGAESRTEGGHPGPFQNLRAGTNKYVLWPSRQNRGE